MKRLIVFIIGIVTACCVMAADTDSTFVMKALKEVRSLPSATNFPLHFARLFIGRPYVAHTLEVADPERLVVNTRQLDCTTLVENVTALTLCVYRKRFTYSDFKKHLREIRYRGGKLNGYTSRLHYFTDWIDDNSRRQVVSERQAPNPPFTAHR